MSIADTLSSTLTAKAEEYASSLTDGLLDKATDLQNELVKMGDKIPVDKIQGMLEGNFKNLTENGMAMLSKAGISKDTIEQFKNKPTAILDSVMTSVDKKLESVKNPEQLMNNLSKNLNVNFNDMIKNGNFKDVMSQVGINTDMLDGLDLTNVKSLDDFKEQLGSALPSDVMDKIENIGGMDSLMEKATGGMDGLIKNFSTDKIKDIALNEIADKVPIKFLSNLLK